MPIRVLIVEDHPATRLGLKFALENAADVEVTGEAGSGAEALAQARLRSPEVVLLDYRLPDMSGAEVAAALHQAGLEAGILAYSSFADEQHIIPMLNAGALGFVVKTEPPEAIVEAVRAAARREPWLSQEAYAMVMRFRRGELPACPPLTARELEVLGALPGGYSNRQIAEALSISEATVKNHLTNIYGKLGVKGRAGAIAWAWQQGLAGQ